MPIDSAASGADASLLFQALQLGELELANRIVMAPMTRNRADAEGVPGEIMVEHYAARAEAGLIVAEGAWPCAEGQGYCRQPGIANAPPGVIVTITGRVDRHQPPPPGKSNTPAPAVAEK